MKKGYKYVAGVVALSLIGLAGCKDAGEGEVPAKEKEQPSLSTEKKKPEYKKEKKFKMEGYLTEHYAIEKSHYETDSWKNEATGKTNYTVKILPDTEEYSLEIEGAFKSGDPYGDERTEKMFKIAEKIMNEMPEVKNDVHIDSVSWVSHNGSYIVMLIQDYESSGPIPESSDRPKEKYLKKLNETKKEQDKIRGNSENLITIELKNLEGNRYDVWNGLLNEVYAVLKKQLNSDEMEKLQKEQMEWIKQRDKSALKASEKYKGGTMEHLEYTVVLNNLTEERTFELVEKYMK